MMEFLEFTFSSFWVFSGMLLLICIVGGSLACAISGFRLFTVDSRTTLAENSSKKITVSDDGSIVKVVNKEGIEEVYRKTNDGKGFIKV